MLNSIVPKWNFTEGGLLEISAEINNAAALIKKEFLQDLGAGKRRIKRRFMYLTQGEAKRVMEVYLRVLFAENVA